MRPPVSDGKIKIVSSDGWNKYKECLWEFSYPIGFVTVFFGFVSICAG